MEDDTKPNKLIKQQLASNLSVELAATSDRSLLDCSFQTAYENENEDAPSSLLTCSMFKIKSRALVDSNNEESSDGEGYTANSMSTKFTIGNEHEEFSGDNDIDVDSISCANLVMSSIVEQTTVGSKRSSWREQSLNNRSWRQLTEDAGDDDDHYKPSLPVETKDVSSSIVVVDNLKRQPAAAAAKSILIKVEQYNSMDQTLVEGPQSTSVVELLGGSTSPASFKHPNDDDDDDDDLLLLASDGDPDGDQHQSIEQHNRALDNLVHLNATIDSSRQRFLLPPAPPPTRTTSALDLSSYLTNHQACPAVRPQSTSSMMSAAANGTSHTNNQQQQPLVLQATNNEPELLKNNTQRFLFTRRNISGFHSDYSNQMQSVARIISANSKAIETRQIEERLKIWKKSNKIITHITENPFNLHLDYLDKLQELKLAGLPEVGQIVDKNKEIDEHSMKKQQQVDDCVANINREGKQQISNTTNNNNKQEELNNCASHLSYLYKKNPAIMDNSNDFRTLLYNIICCLLVQDDQVLSTASVGKMLEVIRAHLESASRVYSTAAAASATANMSANQTSPTELTHNDKSCQMGSLNSLATISSSTSTSESAHNNRQQQFEAKTNNQLNGLANYSRRDKPVDFRRISSVSYNDEHIINDLCNQANNNCPVSSPSGRSTSLSVARTASNNSPWAYQEMSAERSHLPGGQIKQQQQQSTSQSSLELQANPMMLAIGRHDSNSSDPMNDSGNGTLDLRLMSDLTSTATSTIATTTTTTTTSGSSGGHHHLHHHHRRSSLFRPKQQPSYMSTDEYLSAYGTTSHETTGRDNEGDEDDEDGYSSTPLAVDKMFASNACSASSDSMNSSSRPAVDVPGRRAELEWTLNKLINIELKHTWLTSNDTLRRAIRKIGVPNEIRGKVWLILIEQMIGSKYDASKLLDEARKTIDQEDDNEEEEEDEEQQGDKSLNMAATTTTMDQETQSILKQIELDVNRTMPGHKLFDDGAEGGVKLRQILVAYSIHVNRAIGELVNVELKMKKKNRKRKQPTRN